MPNRVRTCCAFPLFCKHGADPVAESECQLSGLPKRGDSFSEQFLGRVNRLHIDSDRCVSLGGVQLTCAAVLAGHDTVQVRPEIGRGRLRSRDLARTAGARGHAGARDRVVAQGGDCRAGVACSGWG